MNDFSLIFEYLAVIFIGMTMYFYYDKGATRSLRRNLYWGCLASSMAATVLNILTVWIDDYDLATPFWFNVLINTTYYLVSILMTLLITYYLVRRVYEFASNPRGLKVATILLSLLGLAYLAVMVANLENHWMFYFDEKGDYQRGPLSMIVYLAPLLEALLIILCYLYNSRSVSTSVSKVVRSVPLIVLPLMIFQFLFPTLLLNGIYATIINLVIFMSFQSTRVEVDTLTELGNRQSFILELERRRELGQDYQVIFVALRSFSQLNQVYGHEVGDTVLFQTAKRLKDVAPSGFVFRVGGDVFALLIPNNEQNEPSYVANLVSNVMQEAWLVESHHILIPATTASLRYAGRDWTAEGIISRLEFALAQGKANKQRLVSFDVAMAADFERQVALENTMQKAIEEKRFETWFQPLYNHQTGRFDTAEALIRLRDERGNLVRPDEFIPLAEASDLIDRLTWIVLEDACRLLSSNKVPELRRVSVNITARQLLQRDIARKIVELVRCYGLETSQIKLEITERTVAENSELVAAAMTQLHDLGFDFMMDDFGTGYSNLSSALNMPFTSVKLDKSLIENLTCDSRARMMVELLVPFFHRLNQTVVAEGIETQEQADSALELGVDFIQGYLYARPMDVRLLAEWYRGREG